MFKFLRRVAYVAFVVCFIAAAYVGCNADFTYPKKPFIILNKLTNIPVEAVGNEIKYIVVIKDEAGNIQQRNVEAESFYNVEVGDVVNMDDRSMKSESMKQFEALAVIAMALMFLAAVCLMNEE